MDLTRKIHQIRKKNKRSSKSKNKGLRHFSKQVCDKVREKKKTTYNEVADELVKELTEQSELNGKPVDSKNIRRRVYDALNVLMAMNIIEKEKKEIRWRGLPNSDSHGDIMKLEQEIQQRQERMQKKKEYLQELEMQRMLYTNLIDRNSQFNSANEEEKIYLPFIVIHTKKDTSIECEMSEDRKEYFFDFSLPFSIYDDNEILKRMGLAQPYWKNPGQLSDHSLPSHDHPTSSTTKPHPAYSQQPPPPTNQPMYRHNQDPYAIPMNPVAGRGYLTPAPQPPQQQSHYVNLDYMNQ